MSSEGGFWEAVSPVLSGLSLDPLRVENVAHDGFPDVSYSHGLIELKNLPAWPVRAGTPVDIGIRADQQAVLARRWEKGGLSWVLARVGREWLLFDGWTSMALRAKAPRQTIYHLAAWHGPVGARNYARLGCWLRGEAEELLPHERCRFYRLKARKTLWALAAEIGWPAGVIWDAEQGSQRTMDLLEVWEC